MNIGSAQIKLKALTQRSPRSKNGCQGDYLRRERVYFQYDILEAIIALLAPLNSQ